MTEEQKRILEELREWGADPDAAIARVIGDIPFYFKLLFQFYCEKDLPEAEKKIAQRDYGGAFALVHSAKGASVYLSLTPLSEALAGLTEALRPFGEGCEGSCPDKGRHPGLSAGAEDDGHLSEAEENIRLLMDRAMAERRVFQRIVGFSCTSGEIML